MIITKDEDLDLLDVSNVDGFACPSHGADQMSSGDVRSDRGDRGSTPPRSAALSSRLRRKPQSIPAAIIDKSALFRAGLTYILSGSKFRVAAACPTLHDLPEQALGNADCVALIGLDKGMEPVLSRIAALKEKHKGLRVIILSEEFHPERFIAAIGAGADGYLLRNEISPNAVLKSLEMVLVDCVVVPQGLVQLLNNRAEPQIQVEAVIARLELMSDSVEPRLEPEVASPRPADADDVIQNGFFGRLSDREYVILMHLTHGSSNKHIARELNIAEATVKVHVKSLLRKIRVNNRTQAAMWAINHVGPIARQTPRRLN
jgi:two-component system, NarL family, nitrate/nitrite response regulator NarL